MLILLVVSFKIFEGLFSLVSTFISSKFETASRTSCLAFFAETLGAIEIASSLSISKSIIFTILKNKNNQILIISLPSKTNSSWLLIYILRISNSVILLNPKFLF